MTSVQILGTGHYVPELVVTNRDFEKIVDTSDEWITTRTGMQERHISIDEPTWYLGVQAGKRALEASGLAPGDIDLVLVTTASADYSTPSMACIIQGELGITGAFALDVIVACTGVAFAVDMARRFMQTGGFRNVLIIGAENLTQIVNYEDRTTCVLFGDGAGAMVVTAAQGLYGSYLATEPSGVPHIYSKKTRRPVPFGKPNPPQDKELLEHAFYDAMYMNGREVYKWSVKAMPQAVTAACEDAGITPQDLDLIIPHQANLRIIETGVKNLKIPPEKVYTNIEHYGNTSSASIPICLDECVRSGRLERGGKLCLVGFGAGLTLGAVVFTY